MSTDLARHTPTALVETAKPASPPPMPAPDPTNVRASALVLLGALPAAYMGAKAHPEYLQVSTGAVFAAICLFLVFLARYRFAQ